MKGLILEYELDVFSDGIATIKAETEIIKENGEVLPLMW